ncbi:hypothetical protein B566_EDAN001825, partial [Ephemera danica]
MSHKSQAAYHALFSYVKNTLCPQMDPTNIMTDYETSLQNALRQVFPAAACSGCWFHYTQALFRNAKRRGLHQLLQNDPNAWKVVSMAMALPLLPSNHIAAGFQNIRDFAAQHNLGNVLGPWLNYVQNQWLTNVGADVISVHNKRDRTTNCVESFHNKLRLWFRNVAHPNIWFFTGYATMTITISVITKINAKRRGLHQLLQNDPNAWKVVSMAMALPLLPSNHIAAGFQNIRDFAAQHNLGNVLGPWLNYVQNQWLTNVGADVISVHNKRDRTTNCVESFHNKLRLWFRNVAHPNIWFFT